MQPVIAESVPARAASPPAPAAGSQDRPMPGGESARPVAAAAGPVPPALGPRANAALIASAAIDSLTPEERALIERLAARDREVRAHEEAHARVGGPHAGEPKYDYQAGPDGRRYAVGGSVAIDVTPVQGDPEATVAKMEIVKAAALAPAEPSPEDRSIAARAESIRLQALAEIALARREARDMLAAGMRGPFELAIRAVAGMARLLTSGPAPPTREQVV